MRAVMLSVRPQWCAKICHQIGTENGKPVYEKRLEIRKTAPKIPTPFKCYVYCTMKPDDANNLLEIHSEDGKINRANGKVIGEFVCDECSLLSHSHYGYIQKHGRISKRELLEYMRIPENRDLQYSDGCFGWHISDLKIYDKPKELNQFKKYNRKCYYDDLGLATPKCEDCKGCQLTRPPQSWCYIEEARA